MTLRSLRLISLLTFILVPSGSIDARSHNSIEKDRVKFLASSTFIRGTWGWNEDTYLAEVAMPGSNRQILVRLIDSYNNAWAPLSHQVLTSETGAILRVKRDPECDLPFERILFELPR